jgi:DNA-binding CsgD family transcriptional regulator
MQARDGKTVVTDTNRLHGAERSDIAYPGAITQGSKVSRGEPRGSISAAALDLMPFPLLVLNSKGHCIDTNAAADRLLAATRLIRISDGVLVIADQDARRLVANAVKAAGIGVSAPAAPTTMALTLEGGRHYAVQTIPFSPTRFRPTDGITALLLQEIGNLQPLPIEVLMKLYGLTHAEARLVSLLAQDHSLENAATALGIARTTAKTHLQRVFEKTSTNRQPQVVRLALSAITLRETRTAVSAERTRNSCYTPTL